MKESQLKRIAALVSVIGLTAAAFAMTAQAGSGLKITGGGQTDVGASGAGDTIAFTARETATGANGQVQYIDRTDGETEAIFHGTVTCIEAVDAGDDGAGFIAGEWRHEEEAYFTIYLEDNGEPNQGNDLIIIDELATSPECSDEEPDDDDKASLARGNVQVHNAE